MPKGEFDLDIHLLADTKITYAHPSDPVAPVDRHAEMLEGDEQFRAVSPVLGYEAIRKSRDGLVEADAEVEFVLGSEAAETFSSEPRYIELMEDAFATGRFTCFVCEDPIPYYLGLVDDAVQIGAIASDGMARALLKTGSGTVEGG